MRRLIFGTIACVLVSTVFAVNDSSIFCRMKLDVDTNSNFSTFSMLDSAIVNNKVFFTGENHQFRYTNMMLELKMLKYLHEKAGVRYLMLEFGYSRAFLLEKYIQTGDTVSFNILKNYSYAVYTDFYKRLYEFNKTLDSANKIHIIGLDAERFLGLPIKLLSMQFPKNTIAPDSIELSVESLKGLAAFNDDYHKQANENNRKDDDVSYFYSSANFSNQNSLMPILEDYKKHKALFKEFIGVEKFPVFEEVVKTIETYIKWDGFNDDRMVQSYVFREQYMYKEFLKVLAKDPDAKFYAQFGRCHVSKIKQDKACNWYDYSSIATRINESTDPRIKDKVLSIGMFYPKSDLYEDTKESFKNIQAIVDSAYESAITLFKLKNDTMFNDFSSKYQFVIVNSHTPEEDQSMEDTVELKIFPSNEEDEYDDDEDGDPEYFSCGISYGFNFFDLGIKSSYASFSNNINSIGGFFSLMKNKSYCSNIQFDILNKQEIETSTNSSTLNGYSISMDFGYDILPMKIITFAPCLGVGFGSMKLTEKNNKIISPEYGNVLSSVYKNPSFNAIASGLLCFRIKYCSVSFKGGYVFDVSGGKWMSGNATVSSVGKSKYTSFFLNTGLAFTIN